MTFSGSKRILRATKGTRQGNNLGNATVCFSVIKLFYPTFASTEYIGITIILMIIILIPIIIIRTVDMLMSHMNVQRST